MNRYGWRRKLKKYLPERLPIGAYTVLGLPLLIAETFVLTGYAIGEHLRRCPLCGQRGTLHFIANVWPAELDAGDQDGPGYRWGKVRVNSERAVLHCSVCGLHIQRADMEAGATYVERHAFQVTTRRVLCTRGRWKTTAVEATWELRL